MPIPIRPVRWLAIPFVVLGLAACDDDPTGVEPEPEVEFQTSFEEDESGFVPDATDTGEPQVDWSVTRADERASDGETSMRIEIDNLNDQAKVWFERAFEDLEPNQAYDVEVSFDFGSADWGTVNLWTLLVDVDATSPEVWADFEQDAFRGDTRNGASEASGYLWDRKSIELPAETDAEGTLHVAIGVWGTYEVLRRYYFDDIEVTITEQ